MAVATSEAIAIAATLYTASARTLYARLTPIGADLVTAARYFNMPIVAGADAHYGGGSASAALAAFTPSIRCTFEFIEYAGKLESHKISLSP